MESSWNRLSHVDFRKLVIFGDGYAKLCASNLSNPFWNDVLNSSKAFLKCNQVSQIEDFFLTHQYGLIQKCNMVKNYSLKLV